MRNRWTVSLLVLLALVAPAFANGPFRADQERVGPLHLGMTATAIERAFGTARMGKWEMEQATALDVQPWIYPQRGLYLLMTRDEAGGPVTLVRFTVKSPSTYATSRGVKVGDPASDIRTAYAGLFDEYFCGPDALVVGSIYDGVVFRLEAGRVKEIFVGAAAE